MSHGVLAVMAVVVTVGCGGVTSTGVATRGGGAASGGDATSVGGAVGRSTDGAGGSLVFGAGGLDASGGAGGDLGEVCAGVAYKVDQAPPDMYVMFDQSSSMGAPLPDGSGTCWSAAQAAFEGFLGNTRAQGLNVGIQYFPLLEDDAATSCTASYSTPEVELGLLPSNATALVVSVENHRPTSGRPTAPALQGAIDHMKAWGPKHAGRAPVVVLVTAGLPTECEPQQISDLTALAKTAFETEPKVRTLVIALNLGLAGRNLDPIAQAGGTREAVLIEAGDVGAPFENAMLNIPGLVGSCSLELPKSMLPNGPVDPALIDVRYTPNATGITRHVLKLNYVGECDAAGGEGWYFDSVAMPTKIEVCPGICSMFGVGVVEVIAGCAGLGRIPK